MNMLSNLAFLKPAGSDLHAKPFVGRTRVENEKTNFMIISDDVSTCLYLEILAHQDGVHARYFTEPSVALHAFEGNPDHWSLIFVDMLSPIVSKFSLVSKIRAITPDVRIVVLATHAPEHIRHAFKSNTMCGLCRECNDSLNRNCVFLHKPFYREFDRVIEIALAGQF